MSEDPTKGGFLVPKENTMTTTPQRFTKRPVTIEAMQYDEHYPVAVIEWICDNGYYAWFESRFVTATRPAVISIETLEGTMTAQPGDWIVRGVAGEFYPCKPDIFTQTYEPAAEHVEGEQADPTDAEVEAASAAFYNEGRLTDWGRMSETDPELARRYRLYMRAALVAARKAARHE